MQRLLQFRDWGEKIATSGLIGVKLLKSILFTSCVSQSNTFLLQKADGCMQHPGLISTGSGCCGTAAGAGPCVRGSLQRGQYNERLTVVDLAPGHMCH
ncbi:uncharacterized protein V6R79_016651 [Siganus canaliculatus]